MNMHQKGFVNIILVVVIVALVGAVGYFVFVKKSEQIAKQPMPTSTSTQTETSTSPTPTPILKDEIANWKIYTNTQYGFEFRYPTNWYAYPQQDPRGIGISILLLKSEKLPNIGATEGYAYGDQMIIRTSDLIGRWDKKLSKEEYIQERYPDEGFEGPIVKQWVTINGLEMLRVEYMGVAVGYHVLQYLHFKNEKVYSFYLYPYEPTSSSTLAKNYEDFEKLVSTFSFIQ